MHGVRAMRTQPVCRLCSGGSGRIVLDLGNQPSCDAFPDAREPGPDPCFPLQMWLCASCGLAQLVGDPIPAEEPRGSEPEALAAQAADAVRRLAAAGWLSGRSSVSEFSSPHGGSWLGLLRERGLTVQDGSRPADLVIDAFGMMHDEDQFAALTERVDRVAPGGALVVQYHSLDTIMRLGQWNALRHGHFAYYSTTALVKMLGTKGFAGRMAWRFDLYGGTVLLAASREHEATVSPDGSVAALLEDDARRGVCDPATVGCLQGDAEGHAEALRDWLLAQRTVGRDVLGYGAASRAVALLCRGAIDRNLLPAIVDASPAKHGLRMPGSEIPIVGPAALAAHPPHAVVLFVPDLLAEVRRTFPEVERSGGCWVDAETIRAVQEPERTQAKAVAPVEVGAPVNELDIA